MARSNKKTPNALGNYINIVVADYIHVRAIYNLDKDFHPYPMPKKWWAEKIGSDPGYVVYAAVCGDTKITVGYVVTSYNDNPKVLRIERLLVAPNYRRYKVGTMLVLRVLADMPPVATNLVYLVPELDLPTHLFLRACGFRARLPIKANAFPMYENSNGIRFFYRGR